MKKQNIKTITFNSYNERKENPNYDEKRHEEMKWIGYDSPYGKYIDVKISAQYQLETFLKKLSQENFLNVSYLNSDKIVLIYKDF